MNILCIAYMGRLARLAPVRASDVKEKVGVTILAGLLESAAMQCHESVTFFIFRAWGIVQGQKIKLRQILSPTRVNKRVRLSRDTLTTDRRECAVKF